MRFQFVHFGPCQHELDALLTDALLTSAVAHQAACSIASKHTSHSVTWRRKGIATHRVVKV